MDRVHLTAALAVLSVAAVAGANGAEAPAPPADEWFTRDVLTLQTPDEPSADSMHLGRFFIGARYGINVGSGEPANDMPYWGILGRYRVNGPWLIGLAVDLSTFDFEQPGDLINVDPVGVVDAEIDETTVTVWGEYEFQPLADTGFAAGIRPFIGAGVGVGSLGDDDSLSGATEGGGTYAFEAEGGTEIIPGVVLGLRFDVHDNVIIELGARADYHVTDLQITDTVSGSSAEVDDYETFGGYLGLQFRW